jgi:hypothetical protein
MREIGIYGAVATEVGRIIVADVDRQRIDLLIRPDHADLTALIEAAQATISA